MSEVVPERILRRRANVARYRRTEKGKLVAAAYMKRIKREQPERYRLWYQTYALRKRCKRYGLTVLEYQSLLTKQNYQCAICKTSNPGTHDWHIDHCHRSNKVRGVLCQNCNHLLGNAKDTPAILESAIQYLEAIERG